MDCKRSLLLASLLSTLGSVTASAEYTQAGADLVGAGVVSSDRGDAFPAPSADGLFFSRVKPGDNWSDQVLMYSAGSPGEWSAPAPLPFSGGRYSDRAPRPTRDGSRLYFTSNRPLPADLGRHDPRVFHLWFVDRTSSGEWSAPAPVPPPVASQSSDIHASVTATGVIYFSSNRPGGYGRSDVYRYDNAANGDATLANLGPPVNGPCSEPDVYVAPDETMMILAITDHPLGFGGDDLFVSFRRDGRWTAPVNLGPSVNTPEYEYGPFVWEEYLYFTSHATGDGDVYRIRLSDLPALTTAQD
jgi:WD40-like Beta Propeller Repeat